MLKLSLEFVTTTKRRVSLWGREKIGSFLAVSVRKAKLSGDSDRIFPVVVQTNVDVNNLDDWQLQIVRQFGLRQMDDEDQNDVTRVFSGDLTAEEVGILSEQEWIERIYLDLRR